MDQTLPNQQISQQTVESQFSNNQEPSNIMESKDSENGKKNDFLKALTVIKVGLFEAFFVGVVIILLFGTLNYFNILPLLEMFPNQLGWLPHKEVSNDTSQFNNVDVTIPPTTPPTLSPTEQGGYKTAPSQAKQTLVNFLPTILNPSLLPPSSDISLTQNKGLVESFSSSWNTQEGTLSAILVVSPNSKNIVQLYLSLMQAENMPPSINLASTITSNLFSVKPKGTWGCKPLYNNNTYCENFWEENDGTKRGLGMQGLFTQGPNLTVGQPTALLFFCEHTKDSKLYPWKSCQFEFATTGVVQ